MAKQPATSTNPLQESMSKLTGDALSKSTGTSSPISYDETSAGFRDPAGDTIAITSSPGSGASQAETWKHELELESLRREQMQFEYEQAQNEIANALRQQEEQRAAQSAGWAGESHKADLASAQEAMLASQQARNLKSSESSRADAEFKMKYGYTPGEIMAGKPQMDAGKMYAASKAYQDVQNNPRGTAPQPTTGWDPMLTRAYNDAYKQQQASTRYNYYGRAMLPGSQEYNNYGQRAPVMGAY